MHGHTVSSLHSLAFITQLVSDGRIDDIHQGELVVYKRKHSDIFLPQGFTWRMLLYKRWLFNIKHQFLVVVAPFLSLYMWVTEYTDIVYTENKGCQIR